MKKIINFYFTRVFFCLILLNSVFCGKSSNQQENEKKGKEIGIGPIKSIVLEPIDSKKVELGKVIFNLKCSSCHKLDERYVGPALRNVTKRRTPEWVMNIVLNTEEMIEKDPIAQELFQTYLTKMINQNLTEVEARNVLEFLRSNEN